MKKIIAIIGARPQFIKHYPFELEAKKSLNLKTVHTGQHYDQNMSQIFFEELGMTKPDYMLSVGSGSHGTQTGHMMVELEKIVLDEKPDGVVVYGDTNSTLAGALVASKLHIPLIHIEAGLRSYNKNMPEEVNRVLTDHISDLLLIPSEVAKKNLEKEGITENVVVVGDIMKDLSLMAVDNNMISSVDYTDYYYVTLHRPYNVDEPSRLSEILDRLNALSKKCVFSIHPRTRNAMAKNGMSENKYTNIHFIDPQSYFQNLSHLHNSDALITDSGGMQKEAYWLQKKCVTIRTETEWVETLHDNWNTLVFNNLTRVSEALLTPTQNWQKGLYGNGSSAFKMITSINQVI